MKLSKNSFLLFFVVLISYNSILAQTTLTASSYFCDFEDSSEYSNWELNAGPKGPECVNKWYIGKPGANKGEGGLFISGTNGENADYRNSGVSVIAYREFTFDAGDYELSFDWRAGGTSYSDGLYVCWIPAKDSIKLNSANTGILHRWIEVYRLDFDRDSVCLNQRYWNTVVDDINTDGSTYYLVFLWNNGVLSPYSPGACVDNIMIAPKGLCLRPTDLKINPVGTNILVSWVGDAASYDVQIYNYVTETWYEYKDIKDKYLEVQGLEEGMMSFYVRSVCDSTHSAWTSQDRFFYYPAIRCIDYLNLTSKNCYIGSYLGPTSQSKVVDFGSRSEFSRHTIHWDKTERDPRTNGKLKTVPDGELASVRLGNHRVGAEGEAIEYNFLVDTLSSAVLLLNYAVVLEDPGHPIERQPRFTLDILYNNTKLDEWGCGEADFSAGYGTSEEDGWTQFPSGWWKDWTTVAIDLRKYHGKSLKILFTTRDCGDTGHFGYAYFTLSCSDGKIKGLTCGDSDKTEFLGPDGFKYKWYSPMNPENILSTEQKFSIAPDDTATYYLDVVQPTNENCYYTLNVSGMGRLPRANAGYELDINNCENKVRFKNKSYVKHFNQITNDSVPTVEKCDEFFWDFGDGETSTLENPIHIFPDEGGTYTVKLISKIANGQCDDDTTFTITLPKMCTVIDTLNAVICKGDNYVFNGDTLYDTGCYIDTMSNIYGCDSIAIVNLFVAEKYDTLIYDTICSTDFYEFHGQQITETGLYTASLKSIYGCDSIVNLDIVVFETLDLDLDSVVVACYDDDYIVVPYQLHSGRLEEYSFELNDTNLVIPSSNLSIENSSLVIKMPEGLVPNRYKSVVKFGEQSCGKEQESIVVDLRYSNDIVVQRWGDVLAVMNEDYNGGYDFIFYQWYKNGTPIEGATSSILYVQEGLDLSAQYSVLLTRSSDNVSAMTCVAELFDFASEESNTIIVFKEDEGVVVKAPSATRMKIWSVQGLLIKDVVIDGYYNLAENQNLKGVYLLEFIFGNNQREIREVVF